MLAERGHQRRPLDEVEPRKMVELLVRKPAFRAEEAEVDRAGAQALEVLDQALAVVGANGADMDRGAVTEELLDRVETGVSDVSLCTTRRRE